LKKSNWDNLVEETCLPKPADIRILIAEMLSQPLTEGCVSRCICKHCGLYGDIEKEYAKKLLRIRKLLGAQDAPEIELEKVYFTTSYCEVCCSSNEPADLFVKIKKI
jgi:hypothetical protein